MDGPAQIGPSGPGRPRRPVGVTVLACLLLVLSSVLLGNAVRAAVAHPGEMLKVLGFLFWLLNWTLPAVWLGATGAGLFLGRSWARSSFFAIAALVLVITFGVLTRRFEKPRDYRLAGAVLGVALVTGWGVWYLLGARVRAWFR